MCRLEAHALTAWPATISVPTPEGWVLRATPGLDRGRSNNALTPCRELSHDELRPAIEQVDAFARAHGVRPGIQVSPAHLHEPLLRELDARGWTTQWPTLVMSRPAAGAPDAAGLVLASAADPGWLEAWGRCEGRTDAAAHADTVFALLRGRAQFAQLPGGDAVAIAVPGDGLLGLYCIAVAPQRRRAGLGRAIVEALLARLPHEIAYLQVEERNTGAIALYEGLGFATTYRYRHRTALR